MPYRRPPQNTKKFLPPIFPFMAGQPRQSFSGGSAGAPRNMLLDIPMPNERENSQYFADGKMSGLTPIINFLREHIHIEELILIGLIILLLEESFEDSILLVILIYILFF